MEKESRRRLLPRMYLVYALGRFVGRAHRLWPFICHDPLCLSHHMELSYENGIRI